MKARPFPFAGLVTSAGLTAALILLGAQVGNATTVIPTTSSGDGYYHNELGTAYDFFDGVSTSIGVSYYFDGSSASVNQNTGYLQFALGSLPIADDYSSIMLSLYVTNSYYADESTSAGYVRHCTNSSTANGLASQRLEGDVQVLEIKDQPDGWLAIDVTTQVKSNLAAGYSYAAFSLNYNTAGYFRNSGFTVATADAGANGPYPSFTPVPEPSSTALFIMTTAGLISTYRRRK
ncbi:MAG: PEP-CTERM sorting domain-containing protein [Luteolibacter sp.]|nr:PEP-CTERM sorting domain-containing protein [Luteolibacter sp.]